MGNVPHHTQNQRSIAARDDHNYYPTPTEVTRSLILEELAYLFGHKTVWEMSCGEGAISEVLKRHNFRVVSTDLIGRGYGEGDRNFLSEERPLAKAGISNPPYKDNLPELFVRHAYNLGMTYLAFLLPARYWHVDSRKTFWNEFTPSREYKLTWRPDFLGLKAPMVDCCWYVWNFKNRTRVCESRILLKPDEILSGGVA
jgi:hypothetical protein